MAHVRTPEFPKPYEPVRHLNHGVPAWLGRHWKSLSLVAATLVGGTSLYLARDSGPQNPPRQPTAAAAAFKPVEPGSAGLPPVPTLEAPSPTSTIAPPPPSH